MDTYVALKELAPKGASCTRVVQCYQEFGPKGPDTSKCALTVEYPYGYYSMQRSLHCRRNGHTLPLKESARNSIKFRQIPRSLTTISPFWGELSVTGI